MRLHKTYEVIERGNKTKFIIIQWLSFVFFYNFIWGVLLSLSHSTIRCKPVRTPILNMQFLIQDQFKIYCQKSGNMWSSITSLNDDIYDLNV